MSRYFRTLLKALKGESLLAAEEYREDLDAVLQERDRIRKERDEIRTRHETLLAECTRHRHATWEITHK